MGKKSKLKKYDHFINLKYEFGTTVIKGEPQTRKQILEIRRAQFEGRLSEQIVKNKISGERDVGAGYKIPYEDEQIKKIYIIKPRSKRAPFSNLNFQIWPI